MDKNTRRCTETEAATATTTAAVTAAEVRVVAAAAKVADESHRARVATSATLAAARKAHHAVHIVQQDVAKEKERYIRGFNPGQAPSPRRSQPVFLHPYCSPLEPNNQWPGVTTTPHKPTTTPCTRRCP